jgi:uncharacterized radical SAM superfamily protein
MADITLSIKADYAAASKAFNELASSSEATREKIEKFSQSFKTEHLNKFINKQKLLEASLTGTRGEVAAMTAAHKNYEKEIEKLIRSGLDPESDSIQKLRNEQDKLADKIQEANDIQKKQTDLMKGAETAALGAFAAIGAGIAAIGAMTQKMAEAGNQYAKTSRIIGMTAETFQELDYAAKMSGIDNLDSSLQKLNKSVADVKSGTGSLTTYLKENDKQLLDQLKNVNSNEEAFNLLMDAIGRAPDEFTRAELAQAAFGKSGQELILLANEGADGISALREEARKYGVISSEAAANSEAYLDAQARLQTALTGVRNELTAGLLPGLTEGITKIADFIASIDDWQSKLENIGYVLAGVTAGLTAFLIVAKGSTIVHGLANAFKALTAAIAANPIGAIAVVITAVLVPALIYLYKNWDMVSTYLQQGIARIQFAFKWLASVVQEGLVVAFNAVKIAAMTLVDFIAGNLIKEVEEFLDFLGKLPFVGDLFKEASDKVKSFGEAVKNTTEETKQASKDAIQAAHDKQNATEAELKTTLAAIDTEAKARRDAIEKQKKENKELSTSVETTTDEIVKNATTKTETLLDKLEKIPATEGQLLGEQINQIESFINKRLNLERLSGEERIAWLKEHQEKILALETISNENKLAATIAISNKIKEEEEKLAKEREEAAKKAAANTVTLFDKLNKIPETEGQLLGKQLNQVESFIDQRLNLERLSGEEKIKWLREQQEKISSLETISNEEKLASTIAINNKIKEEEEKLVKTEITLLDKLEKIPATEGQLLGEQLSQVESFINKRLNLERLSGEEKIKWLREQQEKISSLETISNEEKLASTIAINEKIKEEEDKLTEEKLKKVKDRNQIISEELNKIPYSEQAVQQQQIELFTNYLNERLELEQLSSEERIAWLKEQEEQLKEIDILNADERVALQKSVGERILEEETKLKQAQQKLLNEKLKATSNFFKGVEDLAALASEQSIGLAIIEKAMAAAQAAINSYLAFTQVLADPSLPTAVKAISAAGILASGLAQQIKILSTPIPSAETGGRFIVPNGVGSDSKIMRVNPGEEIDVTPRGMTGNGAAQNIIVQIDKQPIFDVVNDGIRSGDILIQAANF